MRKAIFAALAAYVMFIAAPAQAVENWYYLGDRVTYGALIDNPTYAIRYVAYSPKGITLALERLDLGSNIQPPQLVLRPDEPMDVFVKKECSPTTHACKAYYVTLIWRTTTPSDRAVKIEYEVKITAANSSS